MLVGLSPGWFVKTRVVGLYVDGWLAGPEFGEV